MRIIVPNKIKILILNIFLILILSAFLKNISNFYYVALIALIFISLLFFLIENPRIKFNSIFIIYILFLACHIYISLISFINMPQYNYTYNNLFSGISRLWFSSILVLTLYVYIYRKNNIMYLINFFSYFIVIAAILLIIQHLTGKIIYFSESYGAPRMGLEGFSTITGNVTSFSPTTPIATVILLFNKGISSFLKSVLIGIIIAAAILTMGKAGLMNAFLSLLLLSFYSFYKKDYIVMLFIIFISLSAVTISNTLYYAVISQFVNTTGIEILEFKLSTAVEFQNFWPRITDRLFGVFITRNQLYSFEQYDLVRTFFGIGIKGGGGAFSIPNTGTSHNTYIDMFLTGGIIYISIFLILLFHIQVTLINNLKKYDNENSLILFLCNIVFIINCLLLNAGTYHPVISFIFWVSILYLILFKKEKYI